MWSFTSELEPAFFTLISLYSSYKPIFYKYLRTTFTTMHLPPLFFMRALHKECYNGILQLRSSLCNTVQNVRQSGL